MTKDATIIQMQESAKHTRKAHAANLCIQLIDVEKDGRNRLSIMIDIKNEASISEITFNAEVFAVFCRAMTQFAVAALGIDESKVDKFKEAFCEALDADFKTIFASTDNLTSLQGGDIDKILKSWEE